MGKISQETKIKNYFKIFEQIYENPTMSLYSISLDTGLCRNTVSKYVKEMYEKDIVLGPHIRMRPAANYKEYLYLMNFSDPFKVFNGLKGFPHVVYHAMTFGDWNTMVVTDRLLDFSTLVGFETVVYQGVRGCSYTCKVEYTLWDESFRKVNEQVAQSTCIEDEYKNQRLAPFLDWGEDEWKLFHTFKYNMRQKVTPNLQKINVRYETYTKWMDTLEDHCTIHTGFYPGGYQNYVSYCFLVSSDCGPLVKSLFSYFPTTTFVMELKSQLLVIVSIPFSDATTDLFCMLYRMKVNQIIKGFNKAVALFYYQH